MSETPFDIRTFDYRDKAQLTEALEHYESDIALSRAMTQAGRPITGAGLRHHKRRLGIPGPGRGNINRMRRVADPDSEPTEESIEQNVQRDRAMLRLKAELKETQSKYTLACKTTNLHEDIRDIAREVFGRVAPTKVLPPKTGTGQTHEDAILAWADWHGGEVVNYDVMQGYNSYDPTIMCRRAQYTIDHTLGILFESHKGTTFGRLYVFDLGDSINGDHLLDQLATNAVTVFEAMRMVAVLKSQALTELSAHIPVVYVSVPGNHGRRGQKMQWKLPTETADWLIGQMVVDRLRGNDRIDCIAPPVWTAGVTVRGWNHILNHGTTSAKGGFGGISWYSFQRADGQLTAIEAAHGRRIHHRWYGHIHQKAEIPMTDGQGEQHIVGSLKGGDEYALEDLHKYSAPTQKLVGCHDQYGVTWRYSLDVNHADEQPSRYEAVPGICRPAA